MLPKVLLLLKRRKKWVAYIEIFLLLQCIISDKKNEVKIYLSYDVVRLGVNKIDKPLAVNKFSGNAMASITTLRT